MAWSGVKLLASATAGLAIVFVSQAASGAVMSHGRIGCQKPHCSKTATLALLDFAVDTESWAGVALLPVSGWSVGDSEENDDRDSQRFERHTLSTSTADMRQPGGLSGPNPTTSFCPAMISAGPFGEQVLLKAALPHEGKTRLPPSPLSRFFRPPRWVA